jgi:DNA-binding protein H-NS
VKAGKLASIVEDQRAEKLKDVMADIKAKQTEVGKLAKQCMDQDILEQCLELLASNITESTI